MSWTREEIEQAYNVIMEKAAVDAAFRQALLTDPIAAIKAETGKEIPEGFKIKVVDQDPAYNKTILLPPVVSDELNADDLDAVAGGDVCGVENCGADICGGQVVK